MSSLRSLATGLMVCLGTAGTMTMSSPSFAGAASDSPFGPQQKEEIFVTGSRIGRNAFENSSPIDVFTSEDFKNSGATSVDEFLKEIPAFTGFQYGTSTNNGNNGVKMVDLRGCGVKRTLTLINGRRQVGAFVGGPSEIGAVDLNTVPMYMVERIEVLKDGASTTYGSDALCGVVNVITKKNYDGAEINANIGWGTEDWDAKDYGLDAQIGTSSDKGWVMIGGRYQEQKEMKQEARGWAQEAFWPILDTTDGSFTAVGLGSSNSQTIRLSRTMADLINAADSSVPSTTNWRLDAADGLRPYNGVTDSYNYSPVNAIITPNETWNINGQGEYSVLDSSRAGSVNFFGEIGYSKRKSAQRLAPDASFNTAEVFCDTIIQAGDDINGPSGCSTSGGANDGVFRDNDWVPATNPFNPFGVNGSTLNPYGLENFGSAISRRFVESGGRRFIQEVNTLRIVTGFNGEFNNDIGWEVAYVFADNHESQETKFYGRFDRWQIAVDPDVCGADNADGGCADVFANTGGVFNPYSQFGEITQEQITYLSVGSLKDITNNRMQQFQINFNGDVFELPGGPMGWAAGYERRVESATYSPDEFSAQGLTTSGANNPLGGSYTVGEFYGEARLPLADGAGWANSFDVDLGLRYSDYDRGVGDTTNWRLGIDWGIVESFRVRGVYSTGFRAPNIVELFGGNQTDFPVVEDPCELWPLKDSSQNVIDNCTADGLGVTDPTDLDEVALNTEYQGQWQATWTQLAGAQLEPEESENITLGVVWAPVDSGFQASLDYWSIEIEEYIDAPTYNSVVAACYEQPNATRDSAPICEPFLGDYRVFGFFAPDGEVELKNQGILTTSGVDFAIDYNTQVDWGAISTLELSLLGTYLIEREEEFPIFGTTVDKKGTISGDGEAFPEWKWNTWAGIGGEAWTAGWKMRYYGESDDLWRPCNITDDCIAEDMLYHDLRFTYAWDDISVNFGIDNLTDEEPPRFHSAFNANTEPGVYDVIGRRLWARLNWTF